MAAIQTSQKTVVKKPRCQIAPIRSELCDDEIAAKFIKTFHDGFSTRTRQRTFKITCGNVSFWMNPEILAAISLFKDLLEDYEDMTEFNDKETDPLVALHIFNALGDFKRKLKLPDELTKDTKTWKRDYELYLVSLIRTLDRWDCCEFLLDECMLFLCKSVPSSLELIDLVCHFEKSNLERFKDAIGHVCHNYLGGECDSYDKIQKAPKCNERDVFWRHCLDKTFESKWSREDIQEIIADYLCDNSILEKYYKDYAEYYKNKYGTLFC